MAHKRAFSKTIIDTDAFQDMSQTAQLLYFYLNMQADDDGFVGNPKRIMRAGGFADDDFKVLLAKRFLIAFESGVVVIKHWLIHNTIRKDRYTETSYLKEKNTLQIKENKSYTDHWQPNGNHGVTQDKIREDKIRENNMLPNGNNILRGNEYKPDHNPPKRKPRVLTGKQKIVVKRLKALSYFHDRGVENGFDYLLEEDDQANRKFVGLARAFEKRYPDNWKEVVDWWFGGDNAWCDYEPGAFFRIDTYMKFDNRKIIRQGTWDREKINSKKQGVWN